jgi:hypothetical protein
MMRQAVVELYIELSLIIQVFVCGSLTVVGSCIISLPYSIRLELLVGIVFPSALIAQRSPTLSMMPYKECASLENSCFGFTDLHLISRVEGDG